MAKYTTVFVCVRYKTEATEIKLATQLRQINRIRGIFQSDIGWNRLFVIHTDSANYLLMLTMCPSTPRVRIDFIASRVQMHKPIKFASSIARSSRILLSSSSMHELQSKRKMKKEKEIDCEYVERLCDVLLKANSRRTKTRERERDDDEIIAKMIVWHLPNNTSIINQ